MGWKLRPSSNAFSNDKQQTTNEIDSVPVFEHYNNSTGYPIKDVNAGQNCMYIDSKGIIWAGTGDDKTALVRFDPGSLKKDTMPPSVIIKRILINNENICWVNMNDKVRMKDEKLRNTRQLINKLTKQQNDSIMAVFTDTTIFDTLPKIVWVKLSNLAHTGQKLSNLAQAGAQAGQKLSNLAQASAHADLTTLRAEWMTYGKALTEEERTAMREKYAGIKFTGIRPFYPLPDSLVLPFENNTVTFEYLAIEPAKPYLIQYQYRLEGYSKKGEWSPITSKTDVTFGNLNPGEYTFMLKALRSLSGAEVSEPTEYTFTVSPPYYQSLWFYGMEAGVLLLSVFFILWFRTRNVQYSVRLALFTVSVSTFISFEYLQNYIEDYLSYNVVLLTTVKLGLNALIGVSYIWLEAGFFKIMGLTGAKMQIDKRRLFGKAVLGTEKVAKKGDLLRERENGKKEGKQEEKHILAKKLKLRGEDINSISEITGLTVQEIEEIVM